MQDIAIGKPVEPPAPTTTPAPEPDADDEITSADGKMVGAMIYAKLATAAELLRITQQ